MILVAGAEKQLFPEGSVLRPLLFKFFYIVERSNICNCANENTVAFGKSFNDLIIK